MGSGGPFLGAKRPQRKGDHSAPSITRLRMSGGTPAIRLYGFRARRGTTLPFTEMTHRLAFPSYEFS